MLFVLELSLLNGALGDLLKSFMQGVPNFFSALFIVLIGMFLSKMIAGILRSALQKMQIDKLGEKLNEIEIISKANMDIKLSTVFSKIIYYILLLFFFVAATDVLKMPALSNMVSDAITFVPNLIVALIWLVLGVLLAEALKNIVYTACKSLGIPSAKLLSNLLFYFIFINIIISALAQAKINTGFLEQNISLVIGGAVLAFAIGYGFASKDNVSNYLASFYSKNKFNIGDNITIGETKGEIVDMDNSTLTLKTTKSKIILPLSKLSQEAVEIHN